VHPCWAVHPQEPPPRSYSCESGTQLRTATAAATIARRMVSPSAAARKSSSKTPHRVRTPAPPRGSGEGAAGCTDPASTGALFQLSSGVGGRRLGFRLRLGDSDDDAQGVGDVPGGGEHARRTRDGGDGHQDVLNLLECHS
jgi:hypothetical protein